MPDKFLVAFDERGGASQHIPLVQQPDGSFVATGLHTIAESDEYLLAGVDNVDVNTSTPTALFTVLHDKLCVVTKIVMRNPSTSLTTAKVSFGFNTDANDVVADALHDDLTVTRSYEIITPMPGAVCGVEGDDFMVKANTPQGSGALVTIDVFGYFTDLPNLS